MKKFRILLLIICFVVPCVFAGCDNSSKNTLATPQNLTVETGGYVKFVEVDDAERYVVDINGTTISVTKKSSYVERYSVDGVSYFVYDASSIFTLGKSYSVKVKAVADGKRDSEYAVAETYTHTMPVGSVTNMLINGTALTWDEVANADYYLVKVISPTDGAVADDCDSVAANADLTSYKFSTNRFDFSKILNTVGVYKFYINAVSSNSYYSESGYISAGSYTYTATLATPAGELHKVTELGSDGETYVDNWHLLTVVDANSNIIAVTIDSVLVSREIVATEACLTIDNNILDINLNLMFKDTAIDLTVAGQHKISYYTASTNAYYLTSETASEASFEITKTLTAPTLVVAEDSTNGGYVASWTADGGAYDTTNVSQFLIYIFTADGLTIRTAEKSASSVLLTEEFLGVAVQAVGVGGYLSSDLSNTVSALSSTISKTLAISVADMVASWTSLTGAYYVVEIDGEVYEQDTTTFDLGSLDYPDSIVVYYVCAGYVPYKLTANLTYSSQLSTPTGLAFNSSANPYLLTFTGVENAIGYYVYINNTKYARLFTSTTIDLANYFSTEGEYTTYSVKVQAVADKYSIYCDSEISTSVSVEHTKTLAVPQFYKANGVVSPVKKETVGGETKYYIMFYGVDGAESYTLMVNFNAISVTASSQNSTSYLYEIDVTAYISGAGNYEIMVRALSTSDYINPSAYSDTYVYTLTKQLDTVTGVVVTENDGVYTLSFDLQTNASSYSVRIVKLNDAKYSDYLTTTWGLTNTFTVYSACVITDYLHQAGEYYIYVTAIAKENGPYGDSDESEVCIVSKLETLETPTDFEYNDKSSTELYVRFAGDDNADYYIVIVTDPNGYSDEYKVTTTQCNISDSFTIEGDYSIKIKSAVSTNSTASATYQSSAFSTAETLNYTYKLSYDFERNKLYLAGNYYDNYIESASDLLGVLWYQYLYGVDKNYGLSLYIATTAADTADTDTATIRNAIIRLATEATTLGYYDFRTDETWTGYSGEAVTETNDVMLAYLSQKLIELYPYGTAVLADDVSCTNTGSNVFKLRYKNALSGEKVAINSTVLSSYLNYEIKDYANDFDYLSSYSRRSSNTSFAIDNCSSIDVTTTEQLLMAVQYGKKPNFVGDSTVAEAVYANAKAVLVAIVSDKMSDLEKVEAIFNWLSYAYNVNLYANYVYEENAVTASSDLSAYGNRAIYYLDGIFYGLTDSAYAGTNGEYYDGEFYFGYTAGWTTSEAMSQAFTLLCAIEGIESRVVNGSYTSGSVTVSHSWNKVYLDVSSEGSGKAWYNVDLMFSDGIYNFSSISSTNTYYVSTHVYFLVTDSLISSKLGSTANSLLENISATTTYNYYSNTLFSMTVDEINPTLHSSEGYYEQDISGINYSLMYDVTQDYQLYSKTSGYGGSQAYILNILMYGKYLATNNDSGLATIEFKINSSQQTNFEGQSGIPDTITDFINYYNASTVANLTITYTSVSDSVSDSDYITYIFKIQLG